ncbi:MAG: hypothetical protein AB4041_19520 [Microcystaceae cyanobacterium]
MNSIMHCRISQKSWGGQLEDYYPIHDFIDSTKILCSDSRHRILHTLWGVKTVVIPIFGHTLINSEGKEIDIKDMCERDHLLVDYHHQFIPTLNDFVVALDNIEITKLSQKIEQFHRDYVQDPRLSEIMLSPLAVTGQLKSLLFTHNSWFINTIIPKITHKTPVITNFSLAPADFFNIMKFEHWMDNGSAYPPSAKQLEKLKFSRQ